MSQKKSNSEKILQNSLPGMARMVKLDIVVEGKMISHFKYFRLCQSAVKHHSFELILPYDALGEVQDHNLSHAQKFLGQRITVVFKYKDPEDESPERTFVGIITKVAFSQEKMSLGNIVLKGHSPTILMDAVAHFQSFGGSKPVNTSIIAENIIRQSLDTDKFDVRIDTRNRGYINYSSQYRETHYNYLARVAEAYGEQFYYDGEILHFGKLPPPEKALKLIYGSNISEVQVEIKTVYIKPQYFGYNSSTHTKMTGSDTTVRHLGDLPSQAYERNEHIFKIHSVLPSPVNANMILDVDDSQKSAWGSASVEVFTVLGKTAMPFLYPGCVADIEMRKQDTNQTSYFTSLTVTEAIHEVDAVGCYNGSFEAIAESTGFMPAPRFSIPRAEPQIATVVSNTDPLNQGRVQVRFDWQKDNTTHFIRVMSPDAGGTDVVQHNRGVVAIPEVGDQVMIGFEYHHPDFPFAMGGMFHGKNARGGGIDNQLKSIQTRSGIKILMNDASGSVTIEDPSGNSYVMDGHGNINITAPASFTINAGKDIILNAGNDMDVKVGNSMEFMSANLASFHMISGALFSAPLMEFSVPVHLNIQSGKTSMHSEEGTTIQGRTTHVAGLEKLMIHSDEETIVNSHGKTNVLSKEGNSLSNIPRDYAPLEKSMDGRCLAHFRPKLSWKGEGYGFDWVRAGDTDLPGDTDYSRITGKIKNRIFVKDDTHYRKLISTFIYYTVTHTDDQENSTKGSYAFPYISLYPVNYFRNINGRNIKKTSKYTNTTAELDLLLDIKASPGKLSLKYETDKFQVEHDPIPLSEGNHKIGFKVTCMEEITEDKRIEIFASYTDSNGKNRKILAGGIIVKANHMRYEVPIVFIEVKTDIGNNKKFPEIWAKEHEIQKFLNQALINPVFKEPITLDCTADINPVSRIRHNRQSRFNDFITLKNGKIVNDGRRDAGLLDFLNKEIESLYPGKYTNILKVFFINERCTKAAGYAIKEYQSAVLFSGGYDSDNRSVTTHEIMHVMGLSHTFEKKSRFIFEKYTTDNLMDYSDAAGDEREKDTISTYHWQWAILQQNARREVSSSKYFKHPTPLLEISL